MSTNQKLSMTSADYREAYELLRAAHTLLRVSYGACAAVYPMLNPDSTEIDAKQFSTMFGKMFDTIRITADKYLELSKSADKDSDKAVKS